MAPTPIDPQARKVGQRIKAARAYLGLSQQEVADSLRLNRSQISYLEAGRRPLRVEELYQLSRLLQRPMDYFLEEPRTPLLPPAGVLAEELGKLDPADLAEVLRFAEFLRQRGR